MTDAQVCPGTHHFCSDGPDEHGAEYCATCGGGRPPEKVYPKGDPKDRWADILEQEMAARAVVPAEAWVAALYGAIMAAMARVHTEAQEAARGECAKLIHDFYVRSVGELMHQAEHWAKPENETPIAVHVRLYAALDFSQVAIRFDPSRRKLGWPDPFVDMAASLARPPINPPGKYPPGTELHHGYWHVRAVVDALNRLRAKGIDRG